MEAKVICSSENDCYGVYSYLEKESYYPTYYFPCRIPDTLVPGATEQNVYLISDSKGI